VGTPAKVTLAPASVVISFPSVPKDEKASIDPSSRPEPKMAAMVPGARGVEPGAKLALFTVPKEFTESGDEFLHSPALPAL
jgi:hypothetical protein